ncbi:protease Do-like 5, chloroplastic isoform X2 [Iris pallida]|uniref:Protease Do-like 5, chloroplastic isoform X2 n=1 Tax=Iris pallida TaxID=29817 RepID=A0AAX6IFZ0_IRIPA|nr:protease Do-like 5, chloroplastic isoform X2 [Iris pallida]
MSLHLPSASHVGFFPSSVDSRTTCKKSTGRAGGPLDPPTSKSVTKMRERKRTKNLTWLGLRKYDFEVYYRWE